MTDLLLGCRTKLDRAAESILSLDKEIANFLGSDPPPHRVVRKHDEEWRKYSFVGYLATLPPPRFCVLAGEIVHHLRSSLDHLVYALVIKNGGTPTNNSQFPICLTHKKFLASCNSGLINGISRSAKEIIRSVQPYIKKDPDNTVLYAINQYDNIDKHRLLLVVCTAAQMGHELSIGADKLVAARHGRSDKRINITTLGDPSPRRITPDGVELFAIGFQEPTPEFYAEAEFVPQIAFEKCGRVELAPVVPTLVLMYQAVARTVGLFASEF